MPYELLIPVSEPQSAQPLGLDEQKAMHAVLLRMIEAGDAALAAQVHDALDKPFTQRLRRDKETGALTWRVTLLDDALYRPLMAGVTGVQEIHLCGQPLAFDWGGVQRRRQTYAELAQTPPPDRFRLRFRSPTTFRQRVMVQPLPTPYLCFQSWWRRWHAFAPPELGINVAVLDVVHAHVAVANYHMRSKTYTNGHQPLVGGLGQMDFVMLRPGDVEAAWWEHMTALVAYAAYCGTGHKTTIGLGQTEIV